MACAGNWVFKDLEKAAKEVQEGKLSFRAASNKYNVPKSTVHDYANFKVSDISRPEPKPVLTK